MRALIADIIAHAAHLSGFTVDEIKGHCRSRSLVRVRQAVYLIAREQKRHDGDLVLVAYSFPQLGAALKRDHSTVIHGVQTALDTVKREPDFAAFVADLREAAATGTIFTKPAAPALSPADAALIEKIKKTKLPTFISVPKPKPAAVERVIDGTRSYSLDENGNSDADRKALKNITSGSDRLAAATLAMLAARAAA